MIFVCEQMGCHFVFESVEEPERCPEWEIPCYGECWFMVMSFHWCFQIVETDF